MRAHDGRIEHLNEMRRRTHGCERVEEGLEHASLAQAIEALPHAVPMAEAFRQGAPANVLDGEEMQRLEEAAIVLSHLCRHWPRPGGSESYESCPIPQGNPKNIICQNLVRTA